MGQFIRENRWFLFVSLAFLASVLLAAWRMPYGDEVICLNSMRREPLNAILSFWTRLGEEPLWLLTIAGLAVFKNYRSSLIALLTGAIVMGAAFYSKTVLETARPMRFLTEHGRAAEVVTVPNIDVFMGNTSFPSGHTMSAFALWGMLAFLSRRRPSVDVACALAACGVGFSRIFLCQHFLVDVGAGCALGLLIFLICWQMSQSPRLFSAPVFQKRLL